MVELDRGDGIDQRRQLADVVVAGAVALGIGAGRGLVIDMAGDLGLRRVPERGAGENAPEPVIGEFGDLAFAVGLLGQTPGVVIGIEPGMRGEGEVGIIGPDAAG